MSCEEKVSIVVPMYNSEKYIEEMILSVLAQTYHNWEMIIVDDCSSDKSCNIVKKYLNIDNRIKLLNQKFNMGPSKVRNIGIASATGRYIAFLDSDDVWDKNKLSIQINYMKKNNIAVSCTSYKMISEDNRNILGVFNVKDNITYNDLLVKNYLSCDTVVVDKKKVKNINMEIYDMHEDYLTWMRIAKEVGYVKGINEILAYYRVSKNTRSSKKIKNILPLFKIYYTREKLGLIKSLYLTINMCFGSFLKYKINVMK